MLEMAKLNQLQITYGKVVLGDGCRRWNARICCHRNFYSIERVVDDRKKRCRNSRGKLKKKGNMGGKFNDN